MATLGTLIGTVLAVPTAFFAARNTTPSALVLRPIALFVIVASRSINSLIWALLLVAILGPGLLAGNIALALRSIGFVGKLLYEAIEEIDENQVEAVRATGAGGWQVIDYGIVPQVLPTFAGITVFRWDINIRESTILGLVGAGGVGLQLQASLNVLAWSQVTVIFALILLTVILPEWVSSKVRRAIIRAVSPRSIGPQAPEAQFRTWRDRDALWWGRSDAASPRKSGRRSIFETALPQRPLWLREGRLE